MKKLLILSLLLITVSLCFAQAHVDTVKKSQFEQYCMVIATGKLFSTKVSISVDYGQETKFWHREETIKDEQGKVINFNSVIDALNYMASQGWVFVNAYALSEGSYGKVLNYVLRRPASLN